MEVIGADGGDAGTLDTVEGERIGLTRSDRGAGGQHHWLLLSLIAEVKGMEAAGAWMGDPARGPMPVLRLPGCLYRAARRHGLALAL